jgi:hypothetical protein
MHLRCQVHALAGKLQTLSKLSEVGSAARLMIISIFALTSTALFYPVTEHDTLITRYAYSVTSTRARAISHFTGVLENHASPPVRMFASRPNRWLHISVGVIGANLLGFDLSIGRQTLLVGDRRSTRN